METDIKSAVIIFHKNVNKYPHKWIKRCIDSIQNQTYKNFTVYELDYGGKDQQIYEGSIYESNAMPTHAHAHNYLLDKVFADGFYCAFNVNIDDFYSLDRFEKQIEEIRMGVDVVSSNFYRINEQDNLIDNLNFSDLNIKQEGDRDHNILAHPVLCYSRNFWNNCEKLNPSEIPRDDFMLWKRSYDRFSFKILPDYLLYQRIHGNNVSKKK